MDEYWGTLVGSIFIIGGLIRIYIGDYNFFNTFLILGIGLLGILIDLSLYKSTDKNGEAN